MDNDGDDALVFKTRTTPFYPDYTTSYSGDVYKGIFTNQLFSSGTYYSVGSPAEQTIPLNGIDHKFFFQNWKYDPDNYSLQYSSSNQTAVVFKTSDAIVTANLKGQLISNEGNGFSGNGQRKIVRDISGYYHSVYSSQGGVWYTKSTTTNFDGTWTEDLELFSAYTKNPSIDVDANNNIAVIAELGDETTTEIVLYRSDGPSIETVW